MSNSEEANRIAILSDVHGNSTAFKAVLAWLDEESIDTIYHLGDIVGYGQGGGECLRLLQERNITTVQGNHDANIRPPRDQRMRPEALTVLEREFEQLSEDEVEYLLGLPERRIVDDTFILVHGALTGRDDYILNNEALQMNREIIQGQFAGLHYCFFGHTHLPMFIEGNKVDMNFKETRTLELSPASTYFINPGSVGQPRDRSPLASFAVWDRDAGNITIERLEYDVEAEQHAMQNARINSKLIQRIAFGA